MKKYTFILIIFLSLAKLANAYPIVVSVSLPPPYPTDFDYYISNLEDMYLTIHNASEVPQVFYLTFELRNTTGFSASTVGRTPPAEGIYLGPGDMVTYSGEEIQDLDFGISSVADALDLVTGAPDNFVFDRALPEGMYQLCIQAWDIFENQQITAGCSFDFFIGYDELGIQLYQPFDGDDIPSNPESTFLVQWDPPISSDPNLNGLDNTYEIRILDVGEMPTDDYELLLSDVGMLHHRVTDIDYVEYQYNALNIDLPLEEGHTYAIAVKVENGIDDSPYDNNSWSNVNVFNYLNPADIANDEEEDDEGLTQDQIDCYLNCNVDVPSNSNPFTGESIDSFQIGHFTIFDVELTSGTAGTAFSGTGKVDFPLMNGVNLKVDLQNVQVNSDGEAFAGIVVGQKEEESDNVAPSVYNDILRTSKMALGFLGLEMGCNLPLGIDYPIAGNQVLMAVQDLEMTPEGANINFATAFQFNAMNEEVWLSFAASDICVHPGGLGSEAIMHLEYDLNTAPENEDQLALVFTGSQATDEQDVMDESCYVSIDCNGLKQIKLEADVLIPQGAFVPDSEDGTPGEGRVKGNFSVSMDRTVDEDNNVYAEMGDDILSSEAGIHFIASVSLDSFQLKNLKGWGFKVIDAYFDASEVSNIPNMVVPGNADYIEGYSANSWTGFYLKDMTLSLPQELSIANSRSSISVNHAFIEPAFTANINLKNNILDIDEGKLDKCRISMDSIFLDIVQGSFQSAGFAGEINIPIAKESNTLTYIASLQENMLETETDLSVDEDYDVYETPLELVLSVNLEEDMEIPFMMATATIREDSYIKGAIVPGAMEETYAEIHMAGDLSIVTEDEGKASTDEESMESFEEEGGLPINIELLEFEFTYHTKDKFSDTHFALLGIDLTADEEVTESSGIAEQGSYGLEFNKERLVGLPISIEEVGIRNIASGLHDFSFDITPNVILGDGLLGASTNLNFFSQLTGTTVENLNFSGFGINEISFAAGTDLMGLEVQGDMAFYNSQEAGDVGEKGLKGALQVMLPIGVGFIMAAEFGSIMDTNSNEIPFNTEDNYPYWYVDGMVYFGENAGVPISPGVGIYGLGGGVSYNMTRDPYYTGGDNAVVDEAVKGINNMSTSESMTEPVRSGSQPSPRHGVMGLKFAGVFATHPIPWSLNADISIEGEMTVGSGINLLALRGSAYVMSRLSNRGDAPLFANMEVIYSRPNIESSPGDVSISGGMDVYVDLGLVKGSGPNDLMVGADFLAQNFGGANGNGMYYLKVGTPEVPGGLSFSFSNAKNSDGPKGISADGYIMLGHGLPTTLPVPSEIESLFGNSNGDDDNSLTSETFDSAVDRDETAIQQAEDGTGLAFGAKVTVDIDVDALGIYAALKVYLGLDVNVTHSESRTCFASNDNSYAPGINGWYGAGQVYAGLEGSLGFRVKAFGKDHDIRLFYLAAAVMLRGGLPNPEWAEGRMGLSIKVLGGLISCSKSIQVRVGDQCIPSFDDPFGGVPLIAGTYPTDGDTGISPFSANSIDFTFPIGEVVEIPSVDENGNTYTSYIKPVLKHIKLKRGANLNVDVPLEPHAWYDDNKRLIVRADETTKANFNHKLDLRMIAYEYSVPGMTSESSTYRVKNEDGTKWKLDTLIYYTTGPLEDLYNGVSHTIPFNGQQYYLQNENESNSAKIYLLSDLPREDLFYTEDESYTYTYKLRLSSLADPEEVHERPILFFNDPETIDQLSFSNLPTLSNNTIYSMQVIRKSEPKDGVFLGSYAIQTNFNLATFNSASIDAKVESETDINLSNTPPDPGQLLAFNETDLYTFYFKTSKYDYWNSKLEDIDVTTATYINPSYSYQILTINEGYDEYELHGAFHNEGMDNVGINEGDFRAHKALLRIQDPVAAKHSGPSVSNDLSYKIREYIVHFCEENQRRIDEEGTFTFKKYFGQGGNEYSYDVTRNLDAWPETNFDYSSDDGPFNNLRYNISHTAEPLSQDQIDNAWGATVNGESSSSAFRAIRNLDYDTETLLLEDVETIYEWGLALMDHFEYYRYYGYATEWDDFETKWLDDMNDQNYEIEDNPGTYLIEFLLRPIDSDDPLTFRKNAQFQVP